jgi:anti-sigma factor RsiW
MTDPCPENTLLIQADFDGELDIAAAAELARHVQSCPGCAELQRDLQALSNRIRTEILPYPASDTLRARMKPKRRIPWLAPVAGALLAASVALALPRAAPDSLGPLVDSHIRALQPGHLMDVESTDQHTVKPWFDGRLDFAPPVKDLAAAGFPLIGARLDYLDSHAAAALAYRRDRHPIDLYVQPGTTAATEATRQGYTIITWTDGAFALRVISDLNPTELRQFVRIWREMP